MNANPNQPVGTERDEVARLLPELVEVDLPGGRRRQLQEFLMSEIHLDQQRPVPAPVRRPRRRLVFTTASLATVTVAAVAIGAGGLHHAGTSPRADAQGQTAVPAQSPGTVYELAARYAADRPYTPPRPDQWIYIEDRNLNPGSIAKDKGQNPDVTDKSWISVDGKSMAELDPNTKRFQTWPQNNWYPQMAALPTDPTQLLAVVRGWIESPSEGDVSHAPAPPANPDVNGAVFLEIVKILDRYVLPPQLTAALWRAIGMVPGATQESGTTTVDGRSVVVVGRVMDEWRFEQLLLDAGTYEFVGYRSVAVKDYTFTSPNGPIKIKKGEAQYAISRLEAKIVDRAGQTG